LISLIVQEHYVSPNNITLTPEIAHSGYAVSLIMGFDSFFQGGGQFAQENGRVPKEQQLWYATIDYLKSLSKCRIMPIIENKQPKFQSASAVFCPDFKSFLTKANI